ncbi:squalene--hopene cyclase [Pseudomonas sp.]|uniref:squalene--hopene cyclase n=1 Tax=Pseudomonas sp. TaxID=306 RepID=UPI003C484EAF
MIPRLDHVMDRAVSALLGKQQPDGHWVFELESDAAITAEYVLLMHFLGEPIEPVLGAKLARYLRDHQQAQGGWPLLQDAAFDLSTSVKAYWALKLLGHCEQEPAMQRACTLIRRHGGGADCNLFTRLWLALFGIIPWEALPLIPVEVILLPRWFPFHLSKIFCIARKFTVAFSMLQVLRPRACNLQQISIAELFIEPAWATPPLPRAAHQNTVLFAVFSALDRLLHRGRHWFPRRSRETAMLRAQACMIRQLNGEDGYGAALPTIAISLVTLQALGFSRDGPLMLTAHKACEKLLVVGAHSAYCQPCVSPVWDTAWVCQALLATGDERAFAGIVRGLDWLKHKQILDVDGDWALARPHLRPGGWAFQYNLPWHPDVDDSALVATVMQQASQANLAVDCSESIARAREWVQGMQNRKGGWGAYEAENTQYYLNSIPFAEHGLMIDGPSADVSARCLAMLARLEATPTSQGAIDKAVRYLLAEQQLDGSWLGRWGINFIYGTWSALEALAAIGYDLQSPVMQHARDWLIHHQNDDGGWGENASGYALDHQDHCPTASNPSQTAWALLGLLAAGAVDHSTTQLGITYLLNAQHRDGSWRDRHATGTGIPRAMYLHYHGYAEYFPLWALARYQALSQGHLPVIEAN